MGSRMKTMIFDQETSRVLKNLHQNVKKKMNQSPRHSNSSSASASPSPSKGGNHFCSTDDHELSFGSSIIADLDKPTTSQETQGDHLNIEDDEFHSIQL